MYVFDSKSASELPNKGLIPSPRDEQERKVGLYTSANGDKGCRYVGRLIPGMRSVERGRIPYAVGRMPARSALKEL